MTRRDDIVAAARELLEEQGDAGLSMRRIADRVGIRAASLYKHVPDKAALEVVLIAHGLSESGAALSAAGDSLPAIARAYRSWALAHPHLYALMTTRPLPRDRLPSGLEEQAAAPIVAAFDGDEDRARAAWAAAHGLASLELAQRFPEDADLDAAWAAMVAAFSG
jgi:AcrR family transcriptional regulator